MTNDDIFLRRITIMSVVLISISGILLVRLLSFQFRMDPQVKAQLEQRAESQYSRTVEELPKRGQIYDRDGNLLATNSYLYRVGVSPNQINGSEREEIARQLAEALDLLATDVFMTLKPRDDGTFPPYVLLASGVDFATGQDLIAQEIDGLVIERIPIRLYPQGNLMSRIVGNFAEGAGRGYLGVEGFYNSLLAGQSRRITRSMIPGLDEADNVIGVRDGIALRLTIDRELQFLAQDVLNAAIEQPALFNTATAGATGGTIIIMNPRTGEVLAMASHPPYDPDTPTVDNAGVIDRNPAISDIYEPGSVFKVITMAMALDAGTHTPEWTYTDPGCFEGGGVQICNWDRRSHGTPTFRQVFIESLNTGTATVFAQMGPYEVYPRLREFGIGSPTGVDLEGESGGLLIEPGNIQWSEAQFLNTSYGQGVAVTPLQMLCAVNAIANEGLIMQPHVVKARIDGSSIVETRPTPSHRAIGPEAAATATDIMVDIIQQNTDIDFDLPSHRVAGKTGTAEIPTAYGGYEDNASIATFVAFLPADDPIVSVLIKIDRPQGYWGSKTAAPVAQYLLERLVVLMEIPPDIQRAALQQDGDPFKREYWLDPLDKN
jgi:cell division protein FtsI (penicillin-binding protein 3)